jgi:ribulose-phosphate 3-epimerase
MAKVVPTVLATTPSEYQTKLERASGLSKRVHVDICDGEFASNKTIGLAQVHYDEDIEVDLHLMLKDPAAQLQTALSLKPRLIIIHAEAEGDLLPIIEQMRSVGIQAGVALLPQTTPEKAEKLIQKADHVLIFTGTLGQNGGLFQHDQLLKTEKVRDINPEVEISVDGGISDLNGALIATQGIDVLYVGSFLQDAVDPAAALASLNHQIGADA